MIVVCPDCPAARAARALVIHDDLWSHVWLALGASRRRFTAERAGRAAYRAMQHLSRRSGDTPQITGA
jgi:hypothetical protein